MRAKNPNHLRRLIEQRLSRRDLLKAGSGAAAAGMLSACARSTSAEAGTAFSSIVPDGQDTVVVPDGYTSDTIVRWGDSLVSGVPSLDSLDILRGALLEPGAASAQAQQFGYNCDGVGIFPLSDDRLVLCVNNEFPTAPLMFPGWLEAARARELEGFIAANPECNAVMQAAVGVSNVELVRDNGRWRLVQDSPYNRRITAHTEMQFSGPAREHRLLGGAPGTTAAGNGTTANCAAGSTPWGTYLTAEENVQDYFSNGEDADFDPQAQAFHDRFGYRRRRSSYGWEYSDSRFDLRSNPNEPFKFGWVVEIDPLNPDVPPRKLTALGRFRHEAATTTVAEDGRVVVYMGDDQTFEYFYKYVSDARFDPANPAANRQLLDEGTLYVARLEADGTGSWQPLVWSANGLLSPANGFDSQADVVMNCRGAADLLQATPLDRPEDAAIDPATARVYLACTQNTNRGMEAGGMAARRGVDTSVDAPNPRAENRSGHIIEFTEAGGDSAAEQFRWDLLVVAGAAEADRLVALSNAPMGSDEVYFAGITDPTILSGFANPDNLGVDSRGNLWIVTDGNQPDGNNGCFVCPHDGPMRGAVRQFMEGPPGAEICGCEFTADERTLFLAVQHPGSGGTFDSPLSAWPDGFGKVPRPSLIAIEVAGASARIGEV